MYASVVVDTGSSSPLDVLTYKVPGDLVGKIDIGASVLVPLGPRQAVGYVIDFQDVTDLERVREIIGEVESPVTLGEDTVKLARWLSSEYLCPLARAVSGVLPSVMHRRLKCCVLPIGLPARLDALSASQRVLLAKVIALGSRGGVTVDYLAQKSSRSSVLRDLKVLEAAGLVRRTWTLADRGGRSKTLAGVRLVSNSSGGLVGTNVSHFLTPLQAQTLEVIRAIGRDVTRQELQRSHGVTTAVVKALVRKGFLEEVDIPVRRGPSFTPVESEPPRLTGEQNNAVALITTALSTGKYKGFLLHGVTASGKTEVYIRSIQHALALGRSGLVLLPEIALTTQVMNIFKTRLGDRVAILHSGLSESERYDEWSRVCRGEADVVLGARSAVFAPLKNLGLVVVDEEQEGSYKQDTAPRYHGRQVAIKRGQDYGAVVVLGSATPSVETYYRTQQGDFELIEMTNRVESRPMPRVSLVDLRKEYAGAGPSIFSRLLEACVADRLSRRQQIMLLQNRRAYSTFLLCRDCGFVARCPNCAVSLKYYSEARRLSCHHCEFAQSAPTVCPKCGGARIGRFGIGTERVAEEAAKRFPRAKILRMDSDTTSRKGAHAEILNQFRNGQADILVGTQMIAKGLDFPSVTLVGVISADTSLNLPDFTASERTFQLISQVIGRSGRGADPGEVVIQTFEPEHYAIACAANHDYAGFYVQELENRREAGYPPFQSLVNIVARDKDERAAENLLDKVVQLIRTHISSAGVDVRVQGPVPAVLSRLRGEYRWRALIRSEHRDAMLSVLREVFSARPDLRRKIVVDVDPASML